MTNLLRLKEELKGMVDKGIITIDQYQSKIDEAISQDNLEQDNKPSPCSQNKMKIYHFVFMFAGGIIGYLISKKYKL